ncbi:MAG: sigma-70 family RNA polymerase sigma factor [Deltaproteobacteria bacterium]|nr:sigma-70 family RNA polymerase sigma factor [Deltaproteobacteria bacterium]
MEVTPRPVTEVLRQWRGGDRQALERLLPLVYEELRRQAGRYLRQERQDHTLQPTALVHEAYLRLADKVQPQWRDRVHFHAVAAQLMRRILVDHARRHGASKRGGSAVLISLEDAAAGAPMLERGADLVALDEALERLTKQDPRKGRIIELRFFGGLTLEETAQMLEVSIPTVVNDTRMARAWLFHQLKSEGSLPVPGKTPPSDGC